MPYRSPSTVVSTVAGYQHPLAFLLGLQGVALLRALAGDNGRFGDGIDVSDVDSVGGSRVWAGYCYDDARDPLIEVEQAVVHPILAALSVGRAFDAACRTGEMRARHKPGG